MPRKRPKAALCPTCEGTMKACPACRGTHKARCHRCQRIIYQGQWASRQLIGPIAGGGTATVFVCRECSEDIGIEIGPQLQVVPAPRLRLVSPRRP